MQIRLANYGLTSTPILVSMAMWALFGLYWDLAAKTASEAKSSESRRSRAVHQVLVNVALLLILLPIGGLFGRRLLPDSHLFAWSGLTIQALALVAAVWARRHLGSHWSGKIAIKVDHHLIRSGPYRFVRHPIYTAILGMCAGSALVSGQLHAAIGLILAFLAYGRKIRLEEANLRIAFGPAYDAYRQSTAALIPRLF